jgi:hypothetical protein
MGQQIINNRELLSIVRGKLNSNFTELYSNVSEISPLTGNYESTYTTVQTNSAFWNASVNKLENLNIVSNAVTLDLSRASFFTLTLNDNVSAFFTNAPSYGNVFSFTLATSADGISRIVTWPKTIKWPNGSAPILTSTSGNVDMISFLTYDGGSSYYGFARQQNFSS